MNPTNTRLFIFPNVETFNLALKADASRWVQLRPECAFCRGQCDKGRCALIVRR